MIPIDPPTPAQLAQFDQIHAKYVRAIDKLTDAHREIVTTYGDREVHIAALALYLRDHVSHRLCAELLATAVDRITMKEGTAHV